MQRIYSLQKYATRTNKASFQQKPLKRCLYTSEISFCFLTGIFRIQLDPDRNAEFSELMMRGCFEFLFALVLICHHWAQFYAALHRPWEVCCVLLPDASTFLNPDSWGSTCWCTWAEWRPGVLGQRCEAGTVTPNCYGEKKRQWVRIPFGLL